MPAPLQILRSDLARFLELVDFFKDFAGVDDPRLVSEFARLRPELQRLSELFKSQL